MCIVPKTEDISLSSALKFLAAPREPLNLGLLRQASDQDAAVRGSKEQIYTHLETHAKDGDIWSYWYGIDAADRKKLLIKIGQCAFNKLSFLQKAYENFDCYRRGLDNEEYFFQLGERQVQRYGKAILIPAMKVFFARGGESEENIQDFDLLEIDELKAFKRDLDLMQSFISSHGEMLSIEELSLFRKKALKMFYALPFGSNLEQQIARTAKDCFLEIVDIAIGTLEYEKREIERSQERWHLNDMGLHCLPTFTLQRLIEDADTTPFEKAFFRIEHCRNWHENCSESSMPKFIISHNRPFSPEYPMLLKEFTYASESAFKRKREELDKGLCHGMCEWFIYLFYLLKEKYKNERISETTILKQIAMHLKFGATVEAILLQYFAPQIAINKSACYEYDQELLTLKTKDITAFGESLVLEWLDEIDGVIRVNLQEAGEVSSHDIVLFKLGNNYIYDPNIGFMEIGSDKKSIVKKLMEICRATFATGDDFTIVFHRR